MKRKLNIKLEENIHPVYLRALKKPMRFNIWFGGKWTGKTWAICFMIIIKMINSKNADVLVLRKYNKDHTTSTYKNIQKTIRFLGKILGEKGHNFEKNWKFRKAPSLEIEYLPTGRKIYFAGMDDPGRVAGITSDDPDAFIKYVWYEEPIEVADLKSLSKIDQQVLAQTNFEVVEDSALRPPVEFEDELVEIHMTMNSWRLLTSWIFHKFKRLFKTFDYKNPETINRLETDGYIIKEDPNYMSGQGLRITHTSFALLKNMGILPKSQIAKHALRKKFHWKDYMLISLGVPEEEESFMFMRHKKDVRKEIDLKGFIPTECGIDIGQLNDYSVLELSWNKRVFDNKTERWKIIYDDIVYKGELVMKDPSLKSQSRKMINWLYEYSIEFPAMRTQHLHMYLHKEADFKLVEPFNELRAIMEDELATNLDWIKLVYAPTPNKAKNRIGARLQKWKAAILYGKLVIYPENKLLRKTFFNIEVDNNGNRIENKRIMDAVNAAEHPLNKTYYRRKKTWKLQIKKMSEEMFATTKIEKKIEIMKK